MIKCNLDSTSHHFLDTVPQHRKIAAFNHLNWTHLNLTLTLENSVCKHLRVAYMQLKFVICLHFVQAKLLLFYKFYKYIANMDTNKQNTVNFLEI